MSNLVYHYSDTLHLPWIIASGELRPRLNRLRGIGDIDYLWATTNPDGDRTARALIMFNRSGNAELYQHGEIQLARFTLPGAGFIPWRDIKRKSNWTAEQIDELETSDRRDFGEYGSAKWRCRRKALPISSVLKVEAKLWGYDWRPIKATRRHCLEIFDDPPTMAFVIDGFHYYSTVAGYNEGVTFYRLLERWEVAEMWEERAEA